MFARFAKFPLLALLALVVSWLSLESTGPTLYESNAKVNGNNFVVTLTNKGRAARIGDVWCGAGAYLKPGTGEITEIMSSSPEIFRRTMIAPDQQESLEMPVPAAINPEAAARFAHPEWLQLNPSTIWGVACIVPYWDNLLPIREHDLKFCYEVQPAPGAERTPVMCPSSELSKTIAALRGSK